MPKPTTNTETDAYLTAWAKQLAGHYRVRTGDYRLQFRVAGAEVIVERIGHRDGFYE